MPLLRNRRDLSTVLLLLCLSFLSLGGSSLASAHTTNITPTYVDKKLGFSIQFPLGWIAAPHPGQANNSNSSVNFTNAQLPGTTLQVGVMQSPTAATDFAARGKPTLQIGSYPAFQVDSTAGQQVHIPCLGRILLAHNDTVIATWCSSDASAHAQQFDTILATYRDHTDTALHANTATHPMAQSPVNAVQSCSQVMQNPGPQMWGDPPKGDAVFGTQRVNPNDPAWTNSFGPGVAVCDDFASSVNAMWETSYLFQCVELTNRFINEEWGLPEIGVDAFAYLDNYQNKVFQQGEASRVFGNQVQITDDAMQGNNSALPKPGDLLVFQDVIDGAHWTSGEMFPLVDHPGHVVVVTSVSSTRVSVVQENWQNGTTWSFPVSKLSNGYHIIDNSGVTGRITRGWIHFTANSNSSSSSKGNIISSNGMGGSTLQVSYLPGNPTQLDVFGLGNDSNVWDLFKTGDSGSAWSSWGSHGNPGTQLTKLTVSTFSDGRLNLFATGADGNVWNNVKTTTDSGAPWSGWSSLGQAGNGFKGQVQVGTLPDGRINLFVLSNNGTVWNDFKTTTDTGSKWSGWASLGTPGVQMTALSVGTFSDGRLNLFATGVDGNVWNMYKQTTAAGSAWSIWSSLEQGGNGLRGQVQVSELPNGEMYLFSLADDGNAWGNFKTTPDTGSSWSGWNPLANPPVALTKLTVGEFSDGRLNLFATGTDGNVWNTYKQTTASGAAWSDWSPLGQAGNGSSSQVQTGTLSDGRLYLFVVGPDNSLWGNFKLTTDTGSKWSGWNTLTQPTKGLIQPNSGGYNNFASSNGHGSATVQTGYLPDAQLDLVALGTDANVWELSKKQDTLGSTWAAWNALATLGVQPSKVAVGTSLEGYLNLFVTDTQGIVWNNAKQSTDLNAPWGVWSSLGQAGTGVKGAVQIGSLPDGRLQLFALDTQGTPWTAVKTSTDPTAQWSAWGPLPTPSTPLSNLTVGTFSDGRLNLFANDSTGNIVNTFKLTTAAGSQWSAWGSLGQAASTKLINPVQIGILPDGRLNLFTIGADGTIWNNVKLTADTGSSWSGWAPLPSLTSKDNSGALVTIRQLTVGTLADGRLDLLVTGSDGNVWNLYKQQTDPGSLWSIWGSLGQGTKGLTGQVQTGTLSDGRTYLFALGTDNSLWGNYKLTTDSGAAWSGWTSLGQPATSGGLVQ